MSNPLVSVIAINYNCSQFVEETLNSILSQVYNNMELVVIDDCSTDNSVAVIDQWLKKCTIPHSFIKNEQNLGICKTLNRALKATKGKYISIIATDDIMLPEKISIQSALLEASSGKVGAVYSDAYLINEDSSLRYGLFINDHKQGLAALPQGNLYEELIESNFIPAMSLMYKREVFEKVGNFDEELKFEDHDMLLRIAREYDFIVSDYMSVKYRIRKNSLVRTLKSWDHDFLKMWYKHADNKKVHGKVIDMLYKAYYARRDDLMELVKKFQPNIPEMKTLLVLYKLHVPAFIALRLFKIKSAS